MNIDKDEKVYELAYLLNSSQGSQDLETKTKELKTLIEKLGGIVVSAAPLKKQKLSYPIKKQIDAYFGYLTIEMPPSNVKELREKLIYENAILRYMIFAKSKESFKKEKRLAANKKIRRLKHPELKITPAPKEKQKPEDIPPGKKIDLSALDKKLKEIFE